MWTRDEPDELEFDEAGALNDDAWEVVGPIEATVGLGRPPPQADASRDVTANTRVMAGLRRRQHQARRPESLLACDAAELRSRPPRSGATLPEAGSMFLRVTSALQNRTS